MEYTNLTQGDLLANEVGVNLDVLGATMMDGVGGHVECADTVSIDNRHSSNQDVKLLKKLAQPAAFSKNVGDSVKSCSITK